ncbi:C45 family autoproteolytic acyltransferase/hydrolase [Desulfobacterales bacterium HSG2]|nr:C45 family autoproteolytic acyltransferase/hydrolase [Desulfobacterales bacterium HSG2]
MKKQELIEKGKFGEINGVKVLQMKGTPYEMGYQHGFLLADRIELMISRTLPATTAYVAAQTGSDLKTAEKLLWLGQKAAEPFLPEDLKEEMRGIADGANDAGVSVTSDQIFLWNTNYDQWCVYCHPHYWHPEGKISEKMPDRILAGSGGCSSFSAWDEWAGGNGNLIFCTDEDNFNMPAQLDNRIMVIAAPDKGYGHAFLTYPGMTGLDGGLNEDGLEMMTQLNSMKDETMEGCGIGVFTRLLLTNASTVDDAINIFHKYPRCAGIAYHVADAKTGKAAVVETSSKMVCVRYPAPGIKALYQSNHSNCYPGWMGYSGYNMVADQVPVNELRDISTIQNWQNSLKDPYNFYVQAPSRFERYGQLIHEYYGNITQENAVKIMSDRYDPYTRMTRQKEQPSWTNNILCTICALYPDFTFQAAEPLGEFKAHIANMWSLVSYPGTGDIWLAINDFPAQYGGYVHFNIKAMLNELRQ